MKNFIAILSLSLLLAGCAVVSYVGDKYPPSNSIEVFYSAHDVTKSYKVIGLMTYSASEGTEAIKSKFVEYGISVVADAVVITGNMGLKNNKHTKKTTETQKYN